MITVSAEYCEVTRHVAYCTGWTKACGTTDIQLHQVHSVEKLCMAKQLETELTGCIMYRQQCEDISALTKA